MNYSIVLIATVLVANGGAIALAEMPSDRSAQKADFDRNEAPLKGTVPSGSKLMPGSLWQVVSPGLNCRQKAGVNFPIVRTFKSGDRLQAEVGRGGADEVLINAKDSTGKPWMWVRAKTFKPEDACYVRANSQYIKPAK
jgi:hypothetical protein